MTSIHPRCEMRARQPYLAIACKAAMPDIGNIVPEALDELQKWTADREVPIAGAPFCRYLVVDMARELSLHIAVPTVRAEAGDGRITSDTLPGGRYAIAHHRGPYRELVNANAELLRWIESEGLRYAGAHSPDGEIFEARLETFMGSQAGSQTTPKVEIAILLQD